MSSWSERSIPARISARFSLLASLRRLLVRGLLGQRVDRGAAHVGRLDQAVGVERQEQLAIALARHLQSVAQAHDAIGVARHDHRVAAGRLELAAQLERHREHDVLLVGAAGADRAGIDRRRARDRSPGSALRGAGGGRCLGGGGMTAGRPSALPSTAAAGAVRRARPRRRGRLDQIGHDPVAVAAARRQLEHLADLERLREVEHDRATRRARKRPKRRPLTRPMTRAPLIRGTSQATSGRSIASRGG